MIRPLTPSRILLSLLCLSLAGFWTSPLPEKALDDATSYLPANPLELAEMPPIAEGGREKRSSEKGRFFGNWKPEDPAGDGVGPEA